MCCVQRFLSIAEKALKNKSFAEVTSVIQYFVGEVVNVTLQDLVNLQLNFFRKIKTPDAPNPQGTVVKS